MREKRDGGLGPRPAVSPKARYEHLPIYNEVERCGKSFLNSRLLKKPVNEAAGEARAGGVPSGVR